MGEIFLKPTAGRFPSHYRQMKTRSKIHDMRREPIDR